MDLVRMRSVVEDFSCSMDRVGDHDDFRHIGYTTSLVDAASNRKEFSLCGCYKGGVVDRFD